MLDVLICVTGDASPDQKGHVWSGTDRQREHTGFLYGPHAGLYCTANIDRVLKFPNDFYLIVYVSY